MRNHDELTLDKLSEAERQEVFARFGPDPDLQLYGRGLRRRLPSMLDGDEAAMRMVYSLAFSLPGTPVLFYGEEIGMAENLDIEGRYSVRAPMQWSAERHGGFSTAAEDAQLRRPARRGTASGPEHVNVAAQRRDPHSLLNWFERLIRRRRECPEIGFGELTVLDAGAPSVLAHRCDWEGSTVVAVHELAGEPAEVRLPVEDGAGARRALRPTPSTRCPRRCGSRRTRPTGSACGARACGCRPSRRRGRTGRSAGARHRAGCPARCWRRPGAGPRSGREAR